ncbi:hypothetical protein [Simiduia aestuariiviva]|uniref:DUF1240 domain-containing protein n=1 Tax=Simiduia aestuariiviva TaxID=1510459 RepID=A0A839ULD7_9GAMM|nr:hypothetical protein [Simiduia aestuariiviva]MBB3167400.1 hypothetical protein [Simiduia aestuariiviva]
MTSENDSLPEDKNLFYRAKCVFFILISLAIAYRIVFIGLPEFIRNIGLINSRASVVALSPWAIPLVLAAFVFIFMAWGLLLRLLDKEKGKSFQFTVNGAIAMSVAALVIRLPMGYLIDNYLESRNYSYCYWYTPPANFSPPVWVREPQLCIEQTGHIRKMLFKWIQSQPHGGRDLTVEELQQKVAELDMAHAAGAPVY